MILGAFLSLKGNTPYKTIIMKPFKQITLLLNKGDNHNISTGSPYKNIKSLYSTSRLLQMRDIDVAVTILTQATQDPATLPIMVSAVTALTTAAPIIITTAAPLPLIAYALIAAGLLTGVTCCMQNIALTVHHIPYAQVNTASLTGAVLGSSECTTITDVTVQSPPGTLNFFDAFVEFLPSLVRAGNERLSQLYPTFFDNVTFLTVENFILTGTLCAIFFLFATVQLYGKGVFTHPISSVYSGAVQTQVYPSKAWPSRTRRLLMAAGALSIMGALCNYDFLFNQAILAMGYFAAKAGEAAGTIQLEFLRGYLEVLKKAFIHGLTEALKTLKEVVGPAAKSWLTEALKTLNELAGAAANSEVGTEALKTLEEVAGPAANSWWTEARKASKDLKFRLDWKKEFGKAMRATLRLWLRGR